MEIDYDIKEFRAYLTNDDSAFLSKFYPDEPLEETSGYKPPRDLSTLTLPEAAMVMGLTRNGAYKKIVKSGKFKTVRRVGSPKKPIYLVSHKEVNQYMDKHGSS